MSFSYDASTPNVRITLSLHPHPSLAQKPVILYQGQHEGGYGKVFRLPEDQSLDLAAAIEKARSASLDDGSTDDGKDLKDEARANAAVAAGGQTTLATAVAATTAAASTEGTTSVVQADADAAQTIATQAQASPAAINSSSRRRFPFFTSRARRNREADIEAQILAEASGNNFHAIQRAANNGDVIEMQAANGDLGRNDHEEQKEEEDGMRVLITIDGVGAEGTPHSARFCSAGGNLVDLTLSIA